MSQTLTLARPYARAAYQAARDTGSTGSRTGHDDSGSARSARTLDIAVSLA